MHVQLQHLTSSLNFLMSEYEHENTMGPRFYNPFVTFALGLAIQPEPFDLRPFDSILPTLISLINIMRMGVVDRAAAPYKHFYPKLYVILSYISSHTHSFLFSLVILLGLCKQISIKNVLHKLIFSLLALLLWSATRIGQGETTIALFKSLILYVLT